MYGTPEGLELNLSTTRREFLTSTLGLLAAGTIAQCRIPCKAKPPTTRKFPDPRTYVLFDEEKERVVIKLLARHIYAKGATPGDCILLPFNPAPGYEEHRLFSWGTEWRIRETPEGPVAFCTKGTKTCTAGLGSSGWPSF